MVGGVLVVFCFALLFSSAKVIGMAIKMVIEAADQELIGVDITIKKVALNLFKGYVHVQKLVIHNPEDEIVYARGKDGKLVGTPTGKKCEWKGEYIAKIDLILIKVNLGRILSTMGKEFELENLSVKGVHVNVEKPNTDMKAENANIQYVINHLDSIGLIPPPETDKPDSAAEKKAKEEAAAEKAKLEEKVEEIVKTDAEKLANNEDLDIPKVIIHKIVLGDIGAGVCIRGVKFLNEISFHPTVGLIEFDDVQQQVFNGKEDLKPAEMVACIISALSRHVFNSVTKEIPGQIADAAKRAASAAVDGMKDKVDTVLKKIPCNG